MTINWLTTVDQTMSSRTKLEEKRWLLASDDDYYLFKEIFRIIMLYLRQYDHSTPLAQFRLYRKIVTPGKPDRFLPTTEKYRKKYITQKKVNNEDATEVPTKQFIECCEKCVGLFKRTLDGKIDEKQCLEELFFRSYQQCRKIEKEEKDRWFWEPFWDITVDTVSPNKIICNPGKPYEEEVNKERLGLTAELEKTLNRLRSKQSIVWELDNEVQIESQFDVSPPVGIRLIVSVKKDDKVVSGQIKVHQAEDHLVVTCFEMSPMTNDKNPLNHVAEGLIYEVLSELLLQRTDKCQYVLLGDSHQNQAHDFVAAHYGLTPRNKRVLEKIGKYFAHDWVLSKETAKALMNDGLLLLNCPTLLCPEGMNVTLKLDSDTEPKSASVNIKKNGETLVISSMQVDPPIVDHDGGDQAKNSSGYRVEGIVYQFVAELLLQKLSGCTTAIFPLDPKVKLHGHIAEKHGLVVSRKESEGVQLQWMMDCQVAKNLVDGRVLMTTETGSLQFF